MDFKFSLKDEKRILLKFKKLGFGKEWQQRLYRAIYQASEYYRGRVVLALAKGTYGIKSKSGRLAQSMELKLKKKGTSVTGVIGPTVKYGRIQERGGTIYPKSKKVLRFIVGGKVVFARKVVIPAHWYLRKTLIKNRKKIIQTAKLILVKNL